MDKHVGFAHLQSICQFVPKRTLLEHYTYPQSGPTHHRPQPGPEAGRDSLGSDCSVPGMVEDHGSDVSVEDDYQYPGIELWDTFGQTRMRNRASRGPRYPALIDSPMTTYKLVQHQDMIMERGDSHKELDSKQDQPSQSTRSSPSTTPKRRRPRTPKPPPRASYSIFPTPSTARPPSGIPPFSRPRPVNVLPLQDAPQSFLNISRPSIGERNLPASLNIPDSRGTSPQRSAIPYLAKNVPTTTIRAITPTPGSPVIPFPALPTEPPRPTSRLKPLPDPPIQPRPANRRPSFGSLHKLSFSKIATNSSPSLVQLAKTQTLTQPQSQAQLKPRLSTYMPRTQHPLRESALPPPSPRPLPPLPPLPQRDQLAEPPTVSVFEFDESDAESLAESQPRRLAQRLMRSLANHNFQLRKDKDRASHQRSASDGRSSSASAATKTSHSKRTRADTVGGWATRQKGSVGVLREGEKDGEEERQSKDGGRPWLTRQSSEVFGRILGRRSA